MSRQTRKNNRTLRDIAYREWLERFIRALIPPGKAVQSAYSAGWRDSRRAFHAEIREMRVPEIREMRVPASCPVRTTCEREGSCSGMCPVRDRPASHRSLLIEMLADLEEGSTDPTWPSKIRALLYG